MCAVTGTIEIVLIPHVNRQEVYAGKRLNETIYDERNYGSVGISEQDQVNVSPQDFFDSQHNPKNLKKFPLYQYATRHVVQMSEGDCIFIPAFHFYQFKGKDLTSPGMVKLGA